MICGEKLFVPCFFSLRVANFFSPTRETSEKKCCTMKTMTDSKIAPTNLQIVTADVAEKTHVRDRKGMSQQLFDAVLSDPYLGHKIRTMVLMGDVITHVDRPLRFVGGRNRCAATLLAAFERLNVNAMIDRNKDSFSPSSLEHCLLAADRVTAAGFSRGVLDHYSIDSALRLSEKTRSYPALWRA